MSSCCLSMIDHMVRQIESLVTSNSTTVEDPPLTEKGANVADLQEALRLGELQLSQNASKAPDGSGTIAAGFRDFKVKLTTDPNGRRHGAESGTSDFHVAVSRDFDDRINVIKRKFIDASSCKRAKTLLSASDSTQDYSVQLETDLADDKNHAYSGKITYETPQTGHMVIGGGFDEMNHPTSALAMDSRDVGLTLNARREKGNYTLRIGNFVFDVVMNRGIPEFMLKEILH